MAQSLEPVWHLYQLKRYELAEDLLGKVLQDDPKNSEAIALQALVASARGRKEDALVFATDALALVPDHAWYYYILAIVNLEQDEIYGAIECLHEAIRLDSSRPDYYRMLSQCYSQTLQLDYAHWSVLKALEHDPEHVSALLQYGIIKYLSKQFEEAEVIFRQVLFLDPGNPLCHEYMGWMKLDDLETASAEEYFKQSLHQQPESKSAQSGLDKVIELQQYYGDKLFLRTERWYSKLEQAREGRCQREPNLQLEDMVQRDIEKYSEQPRPVVITQAIQFGFDPFNIDPVTQEERDEAEYGGLSPKAQILVLKIIGSLLVLALSVYFITTLR